MLRPSPLKDRLFYRLLRPLALALMLAFAAALWPEPALSQTAETRKIKTKVQPEYPELARKLKISGIARVQVTVAANGSVKEVKELGGSPVLVDALVQAVKKWKYEPSDRESTLEVKFDFNP